MQILRKYGALFLLFLFLFPQVEKEVHAYDHSGEIQCTSSSKHLHAEEHHCSICDFTISTFSFSSDQVQPLELFARKFSFQPFRESSNPSFHENLLPARAPPLA